MALKAEAARPQKLIKKLDYGGKKAMIIVVVGGMFLYYGVFLVFPMLYTLVGSFFNWNPMNGTFKYTGLDNYINVLLDKEFWVSLLNTLEFTAIVVAARTALGLLIAVAIHSVARMKGFFRTVYFIPVITSMVAVSLVWKYMYDPAFGTFNQILAGVGLPQLNWLKDSNIALFCVMVMTTWKDVGYTTVIYLAGLTAIPRSFYEAAEIDGAHRGQIFRHITIPLLNPTTMFVVITSIIGYLQVFTQIFVMTEGNRGGPGTSCYSVAFLLFNKAFQNYQFGLASAISFLLFIVIMSASLVSMRTMKTDWRY